MHDEIPEGWVKTTLGEVVQPSRERALPAEFPAMRYVGLEHIEAHSMRLLGHGHARDVRSSCVRFAEGDVLYGKMRPYLNKVWVAEFDGLCSTEFLVFSKREGLNSRFLSLRLNAEDFVTFADSQVSGERPRIRFERLQRFPVLLPPEAEQERIVTRLDRTLSAAERGRTAALRVQERLKGYGAAVLEAATTGELTRSWREGSSAHTVEPGKILLHRLTALRRTRWETLELKRLRSLGKGPKDRTLKLRYDEPKALDTTALPALPSGWVWARLQQVGFVVGGLTKNPGRARLSLKLPYLRVANVYANELRLDNVISIGVDETELERLLLRKGDLLIVEGNGSKDQIGRVAIWDGSIGRCVHQNHIIKVRLADEKLAEWVLSWLLSPSGRRQIEDVASTTTGLYTLSLSKVGDLPVPLPPADEQSQALQEIGRRVRAKDQLHWRLEQQLACSQAMRQSLLREAFAGRLVPQNADDESASLSLERIRAVIEVESQKGKSKRMKGSIPRRRVVRRPVLDVLREHQGPMTPEQLFRAAGFEPSQVDEFYRELVSLRDQVREQKPQRSEVNLWPERAQVLLQLKRGR